MPESTLKNFSKSFYSNIVILLVINLLVKPLYILAIDAQVQNVVGEDAYGLYFGLFNFCMLFQILLDPGLLNYSSQLISKTPQRAPIYFKQIASTKILLILVFVAAFSLGAIILQYPATYYKLLYGVGLILVLLSFMNYLRNHFSALGQYRYEALFSALDKILLILVLGYFLYVKNQMTIDIFISAQIAILVGVIVFYILRLRRFFELSLTFSIQESTALIKTAWPYGLVLLLMTLYTRLDGVMLERMLPNGDYEAGVYAMGFRLMDAANMIGIMFALLMLPMFSKLVNQPAALLSFVQEVSVLLLFVCSSVTVLSWFYAAEIMDLIYVRTEQRHYDIFKWLMLSFWAIGISNIFGCLFLAKGDLKAINLVYFLGIIVNFSLNLYFIPKAMALGAAWATVITQICVFVGQLAITIHFFNLKMSGALFVKILVFHAIVIWGVSLCKGFLPGFWLLEMFLISFFVIVLSFLLRIFRLGPILAYLKSRD